MIKMGFDLCTLKKTFSKKLREARKAKGYKTQLSFSEALDMSLETVRNWEQGKTFPEMGKLFEIANLLDCDIDYFIGRIATKTHIIDDIQKETRLSEKAIEKVLQLAFTDRATGNSEALSRLIEHPNFNYLISLLNTNEQGIAYTGLNNTPVIDKEVLTRFEAQETFNRIFIDIVPKATPRSDARTMYSLAYGLFHEKTITQDELNDIISHYDGGDFEYIPLSVEEKLKERNNNHATQEHQNRQ